MNLTVLELDTDSERPLADPPSSPAEWALDLGRSMRDASLPELLTWFLTPGPFAHMWGIDPDDDGATAIEAARLACLAMVGAGWEVSRC